MNEPVSERCEVCRFGKIVTERRIICRRFPPVGTPYLTADAMLAPDGATKADLMYARTAWPAIGYNDWCGEYQAAETPLNTERDIRYHRKRDGVLRIDPDGNSRFLTLWERIALFFGATP